MLDTEIRRSGYVIRVKVDALGRQTILFNGETVSEKMVWGFKGEHLFQCAVDGRQVAFKVIVQLAGLTSCQCLIFEDGMEVHSSKHRLSLYQFFDWIKDAPRWAWAFIGFCFLIPIVTRGGAIPTAIGFIGAWSCSVLASKKQLHVFIRVPLCVMVTVASWVGVVFAVAAFNSAFVKK